VLSAKLKFFKWEIIIRDENLGKLHITDFQHNDVEDDQNPPINGMLGFKYYDIDPLNTSKRVCALAGDHGMIDYIFRGLGQALLMYHDDAITLLNGVMKSLTQMRSDLWVHNATTRELDVFDNKVYKNFCLMLGEIKSKAFDPNNEIKELDKQLYDIVKQYDILNYQIGNKYYK